MVVMATVAVAVVVVVLAVAASKQICDMTFFSISYHPVGHLDIYCFDFHRFGGGGGGGGRSISWDDSQLTDSSILVFIEKALRTDGRTDLRTYGQTLF